MARTRVSEFYKKSKSKKEKKIFFRGVGVTRVSEFFLAKNPNLNKDFFFFWGGGGGGGLGGVGGGMGVGG